MLATKFLRTPDDGLDCDRRRWVVWSSTLARLAFTTAILAGVTWSAWASRTPQVSLALGVFLLGVGIIGRMRIAPVRGAKLVEKGS
jgi:hypothetical protein